jgi:rare lipoprotein A (peptidoglycan hydrolase)
LTIIKVNGSFQITDRMKSIALFLLLILASLGAGAQSDSLKGKDVTAAAYRQVGKPVTGKAGTYSARADGSRTASGEKLSNNGFTAACNLYPLQSWLLVTNPKNGKSVLVRVNDRASRKKGADLIQLTRTAVGRLGFLKTGSAKVTIQQVIIDSLNSDPNNLLSVFKSDSTVIKKEIQTVTDTENHDSLVVIGKAVIGIASFYSANLDGTKTSTGERYRNALLTAASNHFKLNTWVRVTNLRNKKTVVVRINDHMHPRMKKRGRVVDLSREAARQLDFMENGLVKVKVEPVRILKTTVRPMPQGDTIPRITDSIPLKDTGTVKTDTVNLKPDRPELLTGIASFYSANLDGTKTATGERYRNARFTAASNQIKLNTWVKVTNLDNGKSVIVRINDRMHTRMQAKGRVVDLSRAAAQQLGFMKKGLTKVQVEILPSKPRSDVK